MGMDRKNKRAQQQAQRDAEAAVLNSPEHIASLPPAMDAPPQPAPVKQSSGIARALEKNEGGPSIMAGFVPSPTLPSSATVTSHTASLDESSTSGKSFTRPAGNPWGIPLPNSVRGIAGQPSAPTPKAPPLGPSRQLGFATEQPPSASSPSSATPVEAVPVTSQPYSPLPIGSPPKSSPYRSSPFGLRVESESFAPKLSPTTRSAIPLSMGRSISSPVHNGFGSSPPIQSTVQHDAITTSVFGTSPFSAPGSKSIFLSALSRESEDEAAKNALLAKQYGKSVNALGSDGPSAITRMMMARNGLVFDEEDSDDDEDDGDFLPSSLHDLLSPEELDKRRKRAEKAASSSSGNKDAFVLSRSVPNPAFIRRASIVDENDEIVSSPTRTNGFLSGSPQRTSLMGPQSYAGFPSQFSSASVQLAPPSIPEDPHSLVSPNTRNRSLLSHPLGSSLPPGLAAGMSRLHFRPANETPPSSQPSSYAASPPTNLGLGPIERPSALSRRVSHGTPVPTNGFLVGSPLSQTWMVHRVDHSEVQQLQSNMNMGGQKVVVHQEEELPFEMD